MNENYLKKIDETIDQVQRKKGSTFNLELLINFVISKLNTNSSNEETTAALENILIVSHFPKSLETLPKWIWQHSSRVLLLHPREFQQ